MAETLTEKVARAMDRELYATDGEFIESAPVVAGVEDAARAVIAVVIEEAAKVALNWEPHDYWAERDPMGHIAAAIRRLAE